MPRLFFSFRMANVQPEPVCERFARSKNGIRQLLDTKSAAGEKVKSLNFLREVKEGLIIEQFSQLFIICSFDTSSFFAPEFNEYDELKNTLAFGLKAHKNGISAALALRIFCYFLLSQNRLNDAKALLLLCPQNICHPKIAARIKEPADLLAIAMDKEANYLHNQPECEHYSSLIKLLLLQEKNPSLILEFATFFYSHKKARSVKGALKLLKKV